MLPKLESHRGSSMEFSSGTRVDTGRAGRGTGGRSRETGEEKPLKTPDTSACMDDMVTHRARLATSASEHMCINRRCAACSELRNVRVNVHCGVHAIVRNVLKHVQVVREDVRSLP